MGLFLVYLFSIVLISTVYSGGSPPSPSYPNPQIATIAGTGDAGTSGIGGPATSAQITNPRAVFKDSSSDYVYFSDSSSYCIRKFSMSDNILSVAAGICGSSSFNGDNGPATSAMTGSVIDIGVSTTGNLYMNDYGNNRIRSVVSGIIKTFAFTGSSSYNGDGGPATSATFGGPQGMWFSSAGQLYVTSDTYFYVRMISSSGIVSTIAGNGVKTYGGDGGAATSASFGGLEHVLLDTTAVLYIADASAGRVRSVSASGIITTVFGGGSTPFTEGNANTAQYLTYCSGLAIDALSGDIYASARSGNRVAVAYKSTGLSAAVTGTGSTTTSGDNGDATAASVYGPDGICLEAWNRLYIVERFGRRIRLVYALNPTATPTFAPTFTSTMTPSLVPTVIPSMVPSIVPSSAPTISPTVVPTVNPSVVPSIGPTLTPTTVPSIQPSVLPTLSPTIIPTLLPTIMPSVGPSVAPTQIPTVVPTMGPSLTPSIQPTVTPTVVPTVTPTCLPSLRPSSAPSVIPSISPSVVPSLVPSVVPTIFPTVVPSVQPSVVPSVVPTTTTPSVAPTVMPSLLPSATPTVAPSIGPSQTPTVAPSVVPTVVPSVEPSKMPTVLPTISPTVLPSISPSVAPTIAPTIVPSSSPSIGPSVAPSIVPSFAPSIAPSVVPTSVPSVSPSQCPTVPPSLNPTLIPTIVPTCLPTEAPSPLPSNGPTVAPSTVPTVAPTAVPTVVPSEMPSVEPTVTPTIAPSALPSVTPSIEPSGSPTIIPTILPSVQPSESPSVGPSVPPSVSPSLQPSQDPSLPPTYQPTVRPTTAPSEPPSRSPTDGPSPLPTTVPSEVPSFSPSCRPIEAPSHAPSFLPSVVPSGVPTVGPTAEPSASPSAEPTVSPTLSSTESPSLLPSESPLLISSQCPSIAPTYTSIPTAEARIDSRVPTALPSLSHESVGPTVRPSMSPVDRARATLPNNRTVSVLGPRDATFKVVLPLGVTLSPSDSAYYVFSDINVQMGESGSSFIVWGNKNRSSSVVLQDGQIGSYQKTCRPDTVKRSASVVGDVNADGFDDLIIGDPFASRCYVLYGNEAGLKNMTSGFTIFGEQQSDLTGWSVSGAGDVNNDSIADIMIGAPNARGVGALYVIYGERHGSVDVYLNNLTASRGFAVYGNQKSDYLGVSVSSAGDVNRDGCDDVIVGALLTSNLISGAAYVLYGCVSKPGSVNGLVQDEGFKLSGDAFSYSGSFVSGAGDVNGDGYDDVLVSSSILRSSLSVPVCYLVYGGPVESVSSRLLSTVDSRAGFRIFGGGGGGGTIPSSVGDLNQDGLSEIMLTSSGDEDMTKGLVVLTSVHSLELVTAAPSVRPTRAPTTSKPSYSVTRSPTNTRVPTAPTAEPSQGAPVATLSPSAEPTAPTELPSQGPTEEPSVRPTCRMTSQPTFMPSVISSEGPTTVAPTKATVTRQPVISPTMRPTVTRTTTPTAAPVLVQYVNEPNAVVNVSNANVQYVVNVTGSVSIIGSGGTHVFVLFPIDNSSLTIAHFNKSGDVIDLRAFHYITEFQQLLLREGSVIVTLSPSQFVHILNLHVADLSAQNFLFYEGSGTPDLTMTQILVIKIVSGVSAGVFGLIVMFMIQRGVRQLKKRYEVAPVSRLYIVIKTTTDGLVIDAEGVVRDLIPLESEEEELTFDAGALHRPAEEWANSSRDVGVESSGYHTGSVPSSSGLHESSHYSHSAAVSTIAEGPVRVDWTQPHFQEQMHRVESLQSDGNSSLVREKEDSFLESWNESEVLSVSGEEIPPSPLGVVHQVPMLENVLESILDKSPVMVRGSRLNSLGDSSAYDSIDSSIGNRDMESVSGSDLSDMNSNDSKDQEASVGAVLPSRSTVFHALHGYESEEDLDSIESSMSA